MSWRSQLLERLLARVVVERALRLDELDQAGGVALDQLFLDARQVGGGERLAGVIAHLHQAFERGDRDADQRAGDLRQIRIGGERLRLLHLRMASARSSAAASGSGTRMRDACAL